MDLEILFRVGPYLIFATIFYMTSGADSGFPLGRSQTSFGWDGGADHQCGRFLTETYVKAKESHAVWGGGRRKFLYVDPPSYL